MSSSSDTSQPTKDIKNTHTDEIVQQVRAGEFESIYTASWVFNTLTLQAKEDVDNLDGFRY